ncbi:hypothetical protein EVAR_102438_1 [Eumeta japonica]|uniref:Uncharacterized protein n=1 Tax=Eumeta variegata TaxID=151549 RepID=A0A4C1YWJ5_EUMVA|nr:hypothetical protein EVAR_102438_1 [Eumeta japonica]
MCLPPRKETSAQYYSARCNYCNRAVRPGVAAPPRAAGAASPRPFESSSVGGRDGQVRLYDMKTQVGVCPNRRRNPSPTARRRSPLFGTPYENGPMTPRGRRAPASCDRNGSYLSERGRTISRAQMRGRGRGPGAIRWSGSRLP